MDQRISRRRLVHVLAAVCAASPLTALLGACSAAPAAVPASPQPTIAPAAAPATGAPAQPTQAVQTRGGTLNIAIMGDNVTLDPQLTNALTDYQIAWQVYDRLVEFDDNLQVTPGLAESWRPLDNNTYEFKLRQGVTFHDGTPFNAEVAKANFDRILAPDTGSPRRGEIPYVQAAEVTDATTLRLKLSAPFSSLLYSLAGISGCMISPTALQKSGKDFGRNPVGTGPFKFVEWVSGDHVALQRNESYWRPNVPALDRLVFRGINDSTVRLNAFQSGAVQIMEAPNPKDVPTLERDSRFAVRSMPGLGISAIRLRLDLPPFDRLEIRQALGWSIDRALINKVIFFDSGVPAQGFVAPPALGYDPAYQPFPGRDVDQARAKLAAGGQPSGFAFKLLLTFEGAQLGQALKDQLAEVGITLNLEQVDSATHSDRQLKRQFDTIFVTYTGTPDPFIGFTRFFTADSPLDLWAYKRSELDALLLKAAATDDVSTRTELYKQANHMISDDLPWIFLRHEAIGIAYDKRVQNPVYLQSRYFRLWNTSLTS